MTPLARLSTRFRVGKVGQNTVLGGIGLGVRAVIQAAYLILLSRWLGASGYGLFSGSIASVMLVSPLAGWGVAYLVTQYVARNPSRSRALWATALVQIAVTGLVLTAAITLVMGAEFRERLDIVSLLLLGLAELVILPMAQAGTGLCFALDRGMAAAVAICLVPAGRVLAGIAIIALGFAQAPAVLATSHFAGSVIGVALTIVLIARIDGLPKWRDRLRMRDSLPQGSSYAIGNLVGLSYLVVDKVIMLQLLGATVLGPYNAAFRVIMVFALPVSALVSAALPRLFAEHAKQGEARTLKRMMLAAGAYGVAASLAAWLIAPLMPRIFGPEFANATRYVVLLAPWPLLFALHQCGAAALTSSDRQKARVVVDGFGLILVVGLNLLLLQRFGPVVSIASLLLAEAFMATYCWLMYMRR
ncbi:MAG: lipopolysaccharide biosynthesis protein [Rudaea sp.]